MSTEGSSPTWQFGPYVLDEDAHFVTRDGEVIPLTPKEFVTLRTLVKAEGRPVLRDVLVKEVWPDAHVGEGSLPRNISILRRQLGEDCIETLPKIGYRFAWPVTRLVAPEPAPPPAAVEDYPTLPAVAYPKPSYLSTRPLAHVALAVVAVALLILFLWSMKRVRVVPSAAAKGDTANPMARDAYLRGHHEVDQKSVPAFERAAGEFEEAVRLDPHYARAWTGLSEVYINLASGNTAIHPAFAKAKAAALAALKLDPDLGEAHRNLAYILCWDERDWNGAEREFREALRLDPNDGRAHGWYASYLFSRRRIPEGFKESQKSFDLDPVSIGSNYNYAAGLIQSGRMQQGIDHLKMLIDRDPQNEVAYGYLGIAYNRVGRHDDAAQMYRQAYLKSGSHNNGYLAGVGWSLALAGDIAGARKIQDELLAKRKAGDLVLGYDLGLLAITLNERAAALDWIELAEQDRSMSIFELNTEPLLRQLDDEPRFQKIRRDYR